MGATSESDDFCTLAGARKLLARIQAVRAARNEPCNLVVLRVAEAHNGADIYGLREGLSDDSFYDESIPLSGWSKDAMAICRRVLEAHPQVIINDIFEQSRERPVVAARHECVRACHAANIAPSQRDLSSFFNMTDTGMWRIVAGRPSRAGRKQ